MTTMENGRLMFGWTHTSFHSCCFDSSLDNIWTLANRDGDYHDNCDDSFTRSEIVMICDHSNDDNVEVDVNHDDDEFIIFVFTPASITLVPLANNDSDAD